MNYNNVINVTEIKWNIFGQVWLLKNLFSFECLYFSKYDIWMLLFVFWLRNRPSIKYVSNWENGGESSKMCTGGYSGRGVEKLIIRYVRTKWIAPNKFCEIFFVYWFGQVHYSITASKKFSLFSSIIITIILSSATIRI